MITTEKNSSSSSNVPASIKCDPNAITDFPDQYKVFDEAVDYIYAYTNQFPGFALNQGAGAEIGRAVLADFENGDARRPQSNIHCGLMLYYCYDEQRDYFFIAYKAVTNLDDTIDQFPVADNDIFYLSSCEFTFDAAEIIDTESIRNAILNRSKGCDFSWQTITGTELNIFGNAFVAKFNNENVIKSPIAFFHKIQIGALLTQNDGGAADEKCVGVRLYFGFDIIQYFKIRLVAFGIDGNGKNIVITYDNQPSKMLERSWPPF